MTSFTKGRKSSARSRKGGHQAKELPRNTFINNQASAKEVTYQGKPYEDFDFSAQMKKNLDFKGFTQTTEIQEKAIPEIINKTNLLGISATGSGKTGAFLIPLIDALISNNGEKLIVIAPTRELAEQIHKEALSLMRGTKLFSTLVIGGESMQKQINKLQKHNDIVIGTPGRIKDLIQQEKLDLKNYNNVVIDEVDRMFDMGFITDIRFIFAQTPQNRHALFFSATHNNQVEDIVNSLVDSYNIIKLSSNTPTNHVVQSVIDYSHSREKMTLLQELLEEEEVEKAIIFVETKRYADDVEQILRKNNFRVASIHGDKRQNVRKKVIDLFTKSKVDVLVATNVAARGIDIDDITHVINLDQPQSYDEYIHRIGRTGRNGAYGKALTFVKRK